MKMYKVTEQELQEAIEQAIERLDIEGMLRKILQEIEDKKFNEQVEAYKEHIEKYGNPLDRLLEQQQRV